MDFSPDLTLHLSELSESLDDGTDLQAALSVLTEHLTSVVNSFLDLTITIGPENNPGRDNTVTLDALPSAQAAEVRTSLLLPLDTLGSAPAGNTVIFYASQPGAFVDLAADTRYASFLDGRVILDQHMPGPNRQSASADSPGHQERCTINQAIGILIGEGNPLEQAPAILREYAERDGVTVAQAAHNLMDTALPGEADQPDS